MSSRLSFSSLPSKISRGCPFCPPCASSRFCLQAPHYICYLCLDFLRHFLLSSSQPSSKPHYMFCFEVLPIFIVTTVFPPPSVLFSKDISLLIYSGKDDSNPPQKFRALLFSTILRVCHPFHSSLSAISNPFFFFGRFHSELSPLVEYPKGTFFPGPIETDCQPRLTFVMPLSRSSACNASNRAPS